MPPPATIDPVTTFAGAMRLVAAMLAAEQGCPPDQITDDRVHLGEHPAGARRHRLARPYPRRDPAFAAVSVGSGAVVSAGRDILPDVRAIFAGAERDQVFEPERLAAIAALLRPHQLTVVGPYLRFLCTPTIHRHRPPPAGYLIGLELRPDDRRLDSLDPDRWPNAISRRRPITTEAAVVAELAGQVVGVATARADSPRLWQIGIDVAEPHRGRGLGAALTSALARFIIDNGNAAWYGVAPANVASVNTALASGFRYAWVEAYAYPTSRDPSS
ncbi:MAG: GNAT family N-acetyltransferase [Dehalococcoidia bacterium]